ncbi:related to SHE9 - mitochondrial inner membrane protein [Ustilago trichophora]|uniref:Sensitive to high expression protein 9, mitochondrial n=1 Tax=Ustilago trichophora TaxID=86804 RepID=A0A5C3EE78_9BASI|nr:related to SHE9 - mitochondrial inner membrane protein [Ustilago trichophora]
MRIALTRSILAPIGRCSKSTLASSSRLQIDSWSERGFVSNAPWNRVRLDKGRATMWWGCGAALQCRGLSSSIARCVEDEGSKDKSRPTDNTESQRSDADNDPPLVSREEPIAGSQSSSQSLNASRSASPTSATPEKPEEAIASSSTSEPTPPPPSPAEHPPHSSQRQSSSSPSSSPFLERLRHLTSELSKLDGLTATSSLSTLLTTATTRAQHLGAQLRNKLSHLSSQYNTYSGYSAIEDLKLRITALETSLDSARALAVTAKKTYLTAVQNRSASQRETNDLLSRKNSWSEADLGRYTELLRKEHALSREEAEAEKELEKSEGEVQGAFDELMKAVLVRYHEEQIWSDRMRGWSTYGSLVVAGLNAFLFILAILLVEPYKRKKLAQTFESRLIAAEQESRKLILASVEQFQLSLNAALTPTTPDRVVVSDLETPSSSVLAEPVQKVQQVGEDKVASSIPVEPQSQPQPQPQPAVQNSELRRKRQEDERLVFASTVGVVVGATLSLLISACWS